MEDNKLVFFVCVVLTVSGVLVFSFSEPVEVDSLSPGFLGEEVFLRGEVNSKRVSDGHVFLEVNGFKAVVFAGDAEALETPYFLLEGDCVVLRGFVKDYKGELELVVSDVIAC